ncbi:hypothetical protein ACO2Q0_15125 [Phenylobacterium sp. VNQ135]|uniref:hypothetical protein n=1 Tax=Phenylobacterium sp. VNQ135 TaxID=3400922 RepID=UPI003C09D86C
MRLRTALLATLGGVSLGASPAAAQPDNPKAPLSVQLQPCGNAADVPLCILKVLAAKDSGEMLWRDDALQARPALLAAAGVKVEAAQQAAGSDTARLFFGPSDDAQAALRRAIAREREGASADLALGAIMALPSGAPELPLFFADSQTASIRLLGLQAVDRAARGEIPDLKPSPALHRAALAAWEAELAARGGLADMLTDPGTLATAYAAVGDAGGATRAVALEPRPDKRALILAELGRIEDAAVAAARLERRDLEPSVRAEIERLQARQAAAASATDRHMKGELARMIAEARSGGDEKAARQLEKMRGVMASEGAPPLPPDLVEGEIDDRLSALWRGLFSAAGKAGRPTAARPVAERLFRESPPPKVSDALAAHIEAATAAAPDLAAPWLDAQEKQLSRGGDDQMSIRVEAVADGWLALGRTDRVEALIARLRSGSVRHRRLAAFRLLALDRPAEAQALAPIGADELLRADIRRGRGVSRLRIYLAGIQEPHLRSSLLGTCEHETQQALLWRELLICMEVEREAATRPVQFFVDADSALTALNLPASLGDLTSARALFRFALDTAARGLALEPNYSDAFGGVMTRVGVLAYAKAELRADGRLPKSPPPPQP